MKQYARNSSAPIAVLAACAVVLSACNGVEISGSKEPVSEHVSNKTKFSQEEFQVAASPRVTAEKRPRKGGGRYQVGKPYKVRGKWYHPVEDENLKQTGLASWYGPNFHGRLTANGEIYDQYSLSAAHPTMPLPSYAKVTNLENGRQVMVRVNDRGPFAHGRVIDLSNKAAELLDFKQQGVAKVKVEYAGRARMDGLDEPMLLASYRGPGIEGIAPQDIGSASGTMIAMAEPQASVPGISAAAGAIDRRFEDGALGLTVLPIPAERPTLFEGIPLDDGTLAFRSTIPAQGQPAQGEYTDPGGLSAFVPRPMAYADDVAGNASTGFAAYFGEMPDHRLTLVLGKAADDAALALMGRLFGEYGSVSQDEGGKLATLSVREADANRALALARRTGLSGAYFR